MIREFLSQRCVVAIFSAWALLLLTGCPVSGNLPAPGRVVSEVEPESKRPYRLYVPTRYSEARRWPLVVTCHGTPPFDTAAAQFDEWKGLGEDKGFLVAAPDLKGTSALAPAREQQIALQADDERAILGVVRAVSGSHSVDATRIFLTGWSAGSYAVLYTGLRHPDVFRGLAIRQGNFKAEFVEPTVPFLDRHQPVLVMFGNIDLLKDDAQACIDWLKSHDLDPTVLERPGAHRRDPNPVYSFFADVVRHRQWIRVRVEDDPQDPMAVRYSVTSSFEPYRYLWDFGDGQRGVEESPKHRYERPGLYTVRVAVYTAEGKDPYVRQINLQVPRVRLGAPGATTMPQ